MLTCTNCGTANLEDAIFCRACARPLHELLPAGSVLRGRYRIVRILKRGRTGAAYLAVDARRGDCPVTVRESLDGSSASQAQFLARAGALARLSHPNLARVVDYFTVPEGKAYMIMDAGEGYDLDETLAQGRLPAAQVLSWLAQACDAAAHLHGADPPLIHGDIEPASIRLGPNGNAVLGQFAASVAAPGDAGALGGARNPVPGFSPPEAYEGETELDMRSDIYGLAASLYCLLTVHVPPSAPDRLAGRPLIPLAQANPAVSPVLEAAIVRSLALDPEARDRTAGEFRAALAPETALVPITQQAPPPSQIRPARTAAVLGATTPYFTPAVAAAPYLTAAGVAGLPPLPLPLTPRHNLAGFFERFLAYFVDSLIVSAAQFAVLILPMLQMRRWFTQAGGFEGFGQPGSLGCLLYPLSIAIYFAYYTYFHGTTGQTLGKKLFGLRVIRTDGSTLGLGAAFVRTVGYIISGMIFDLGFLWAIWDVDKQAWHDKLAGTYVVKT